MLGVPDGFDTEQARAEWNFASDAYATFQADGSDYYRYEFFGPAQIAECGDVGGSELLDIGCGAGYFSREMASRGARVTGVDLSDRQIAHAMEIEEMSPMGIRYEVADAATIGERFPAERFDVVTACFSLQDMPDPASVLRGAWTVLRPGGRMIFSMPHPCTYTPVRAWATDDQGVRYGLTVGGYFDETAMRFAWTSRFAYPFQTTSVHATLGRWFTWMLTPGFILRRFVEPHADAALVERVPDLFDTTLMPFCCIVVLEKPAQA